MKKNLQQLDELIAAGKIIEAFDKYFHENVVTWSSKKDKTTSKEEKKNFLIDFFENMKSTEDIKFHGSVTDGSTSYSKFTFIFTNKKGEKLKWHEIIRRKWENGLVVDEYYYHEDFKELKQKLAKKARTKKEDSSKSIAKKVTEESTKPKKTKVAKPVGKKKKIKAVMTSPPSIAVKIETAETSQSTKVESKKEVAKTVAPKTKIKTVSSKAKPKAVMTSPPTVATKVVEKPAVIAKPTKAAGSQAKPKAVNTSTPVAAAKPVDATKSTSSRRVIKTPDLTIIEGIGPKIKEILAQEGITTFAQVASSKAEEIKNIMITKGGTRYNANNPSTWPEQAALAAQEKWDELAALKAELKHGKRV